MLTQPKVARILFDESHSEAWTIRRDLASEMQPAHPARLLLRGRRRAACRARLRGRAERGPPPHPRDARGRRRPRDRPPDPIRSGRRPSNDRAAPPLRRRARRDRGVRARRRRPDATGRDRAGEVRQQPERPATRFGIEIESRTVQDYEHHHAAPPWVLAQLGDVPPTVARTARAPRPPTGATAGRPVDLLTRVERACFYRAGTLALHNGARAIARTHPTASPPRRAARGGRRARRRAGRRPRRLRPVRRRLPRRARPRDPVAEPRLLGRPARLRRRRDGHRLAGLAPTPAGQS